MDWNDHVGQQHHIDHAKYGDIQYTEPFLNNQHIVEPTLFYLKHLARQRRVNHTTEWCDLEGNVLWRRQQDGPNVTQRANAARNAPIVLSTPMPQAAEMDRVVAHELQ